jgi:hypothetical protein
VTGTGELLMLAATSNQSTLQGSNMWHLRRWHSSLSPPWKPQILYKGDCLKLNYFKYVLYDDNSVKFWSSKLWSCIFSLNWKCRKIRCHSIHLNISEIFNIVSQIVNNNNVFHTYAVKWIHSESCEKIAFFIHAA